MSHEDPRGLDPAGEANDLAAVQARIRTTKNSLAQHLATAVSEVGGAAHASIDQVSSAIQQGVEQARGAATRTVSQATSSLNLVVQVRARPLTAVACSLVAGLLIGRRHSRNASARSSVAAPGARHAPGPRSTSQIASFFMPMVTSLAETLLINGVEAWFKRGHRQDDSLDRDEETPSYFLQ